MPFDPSPAFTGRQETYERMKGKSLSQRSTVGSRVFVLFGLAGSGKTTLCVKLAWELRTRQERLTLIRITTLTFVISLSIVLWINASSRSSIEHALGQFALTRGEAGGFTTAIRWLSASQTPWLLLLDNADDPKFDLSEHFPQNNLGCIIITSRNPECARLSTMGDQELGPMADSEACDLLLKSLNYELPVSPQTHKDAYNIVKSVGFLAPSIIHAAAYIRKELCDMREFPQKLLKQQKRILTYLPIQGSVRYPRSVWDTLELSMKHIEEMSSQVAKDACELLQFFAFRHFDDISEKIIEYAWTRNPIVAETNVPVDDRRPLLRLVRAGSSHESDSSPANQWHGDATREAISLLASYSLITKHPSSAFGSISIHPVLHIWIKERIDQAERQAAFHSAFWTISWSIPLTGRSSDVEYRRYFLPYLQAFVNDNKEALFKDSERNISMIWKLMDFANIYQELGQFETGLRLHSKALEVLQRALGDEHLITLCAMSTLARSYSMLGEYGKALELEERCWLLKKSILRTPHLGTLRSMHNLSWNYSKVGQVQKAAKLGEDCWNLERRVPGEDHLQTLATMSILPSVLCSSRTKQDGSGSRRAMSTSK